MQPIIALKLISSEEIIARVVTDEEDFYILENVRAIFPQPTQNQQIAIVFTPWMLSSLGDKEESVKVYKDKIMGEPMVLPTTDSV